MPYGLRTRDTSGNVDYDTTKIFIQFVGWQIINTSSGSINVPAFSDRQPWYYIIKNNSSSTFYPVITISGTTLSWTNSGAAGQSTLVYGVY